MKYDGIKKLFAFSWRNLWRRSSRTMLLGASLSLMTALAVALLGMSAGISRQMIGGAIRNFLGEAVAYASSSKEDALWPESLVEFDEGALERYLSSLRGVSSSPQYRAKAFCRSSTNEQGLLLVGIDEGGISERVSVLDGACPTPDGNEVMLPARVARKLRVEKGDIVSIEVVTSDGRRNFDQFAVSGLYRFNGVSELFAGHIIVAPLSTVRRLMNAEPGRVTEVLLFSADGKLDDSILPAVDGVSYQSWRRYGSLILSAAKSMIISMWVIFAITMTVILVFLFDSIKVTVEERRKELGIMFSLGLSGSRIMGLFLAEVSLLGIVFVIPGAAIGAMAVELTGRLGIPVPSEAVRVVLGGLDRLYPVNDFGLTCALILVVLCAMLQVAFLSLKGITKMKPVEILKN
jgi:ABC-type lipoprotein release transport system permease subunit